MAGIRKDLKSILQFLPPLKPQQTSSTTSTTPFLQWPNPQITDTLTLLTKGPTHSHLNSGKKLFDAITKLRNSLPIPSNDRLAKSAGDGYSKFFDELLPKEESTTWLENVVPSMADLVLRLPVILRRHYDECDGGVVNGVSTGLRVLEPQHPGIVFLSQELIAALLSCSFFCLFPSVDRKANHMGLINMDQLFAILYDRYHPKQENKIKCIIHYFERICSSKPSNYVSFERKVLSLQQNPSTVPLPTLDLWADSVAPLCKLKVFTTGMIEQHPAGSYEVDFADEFIGGLILTHGCVQEEIRFMMNPELIVAMLFLPGMSENEAIEMVGAERFSDYRGYNATFQYAGDHVDKRGLDSLRRRISSVIAIDALRRAGNRQYTNECLLREVNKAYCGFLDHSKYLQQQVPDSNVGIATGNWGCGVFGGDPQLKSIIQWVAASQASRPFVSYYTFGLPAVRDMDQVVQFVESQNWNVGDLWKCVTDYCSQRSSGKTKLGFFPYLIPSLNQDSGSSSKQGRGASGGASRGRGRGRS